MTPEETGERIQSGAVRCKALPPRGTGTALPRAARGQQHSSRAQAAGSRRGSPPCGPRAHAPRLSAALSLRAGAWYFYPYGLRTLYPAVVSWWAAKGSGRQHEVWESRDSSPHFQVRNFGSGRRSLPQPVVVVSTRTPDTQLKRCCPSWNTASPPSLCHSECTYLGAVCLTMTQNCPRVSCHPERHREQKEKESDKSSCLLCSFQHNFTDNLLSTFYE